MKKALSVLLVGLVLCFMAGPVMVQAEESNPVVVEFSLTKEYSKPLVIPTVFKLDPTMLQKTEAVEAKEGKEAATFIMVSSALLCIFAYASMER